MILDCGRHGVPPLVGARLRRARRAGRGTSPTCPPRLAKESGAREGNEWRANGGPSCAAPLGGRHGVPPLVGARLRRARRAGRGTSPTCPPRRQPRLAKESGAREGNEWRANGGPSCAAPFWRAARSAAPGRGTSPTCPSRLAKESGACEGNEWRANGGPICATPFWRAARSAAPTSHSPLSLVQWRRALGRAARSAAPTSHSHLSLVGARLRRARRGDSRG